MKNYLIAIAIFFLQQPLTLICMQKDKPIKFVPASERVWHSASMPDISHPSFANRFGYEIITVTNRPFRPRALSDTALGSVTDDCKLHNGYSYRETAAPKSMPESNFEENPTQNESSKLYQLAAAANCRIS
jgi:hypothetical protein